MAEKDGVDELIKRDAPYGRHDPRIKAGLAKLGFHAPFMEADHKVNEAFYRSLVRGFPPLELNLTHYPGGIRLKIDSFPPGQSKDCYYYAQGVQPGDVLGHVLYFLTR